MSENDDKARIKELESQVAELKAGLKAVELRTQPPPKVPTAAPLEGYAQSTYRLIDKMSVPQHILREMQAAVPDEVVRQIAKDGRK